LRNIRPERAKTIIIPKAEVHTISPAKHFRVYINMKEIRTAAPKAQRIHCQF
jgi:hypothetical protein